MSTKREPPIPTNTLFESFRYSFMISFRTYVGSGLRWSYHFTSLIRPSTLEILRRNTCSIIKTVSSPLIRRLCQPLTRGMFLPAIICSHLPEFSLLGYHVRTSVAYGEPELPMTRGPLSISLERQRMNWNSALECRKSQFASGTNDIYCFRIQVQPRHIPDFQHSPTFN